MATTFGSLLKRSQVLRRRTDRRRTCRPRMRPMTSRPRRLRARAAPAPASPHVGEAVGPRVMLRRRPRVTRRQSSRKPLHPKRTPRRRRPRRGSGIRGFVVVHVVVARALSGQRPPAILSGLGPRTGPRPRYRKHDAPLPARRPSVLASAVSGGCPDRSPRPPGARRTPAQRKATMLGLGPRPLSNRRPAHRRPSRNRHQLPLPRAVWPTRTACCVACRRRCSG